MSEENKVWQDDREKIKDFFEQRQDQGITMDSTHWATLSVAKELQELVIEGVITEGMKAFEIGCGIGTESMYLSKQGLNVTGIDFVEKTIETAEERSKITNAEVDFICDDFMEMDLASMKGKYDLVMDSNCFHHIPIKERGNYAKRAYSLLSNDGIFFLRGFSKKMLPSPTGDGPIRLTSDAIVDTFFDYFSIEKLFRFNSIPLPNSEKPQIFWAFLGKKRKKKGNLELY